jgi:hypothetical protein
MMVKRFEDHLRQFGHAAGRHRYPGGSECDLLDETAGVLYEAKSDTA